MSTAQAQQHAAALADLLVRAGKVNSPALHDAFAAVPRHEFLRRFFQQTADRSRYEAVADTDPGWLDMTYADQVWATQLDGDDTLWEQARHDGPIAGTPTCSNTQPSLTAVMLDALDISEKQHVLEIGTGTGYHAALLCEMVGADRVTSIDVDAALVTGATANLQRAGYAPAVMLGDGADGWPHRGPYDRVVATCSFSAIPPAWLRQVRAGGRIVANLYRGITGNSLVGLDVDADGSASGRLLAETGGYMPRRADQMSDGWDRVRRASDGPDGERSASMLPEPPDPAGEQPWLVLADLLMPGVILGELFRDEGVVQWLTDATGSWAYHEVSSGLVQQGGRRRLWSGLEAVYEWWVGAGKPDHTRFGMTVRESAESAWLDNPETVVPAPGYSWRKSGSP